jgi:hypothetical protein
VIIVGVFSFEQFKTPFHSKKDTIAGRHLVEVMVSSASVFTNSRLKGKLAFAISKMDLESNEGGILKVSPVLVNAQTVQSKTIDPILFKHSCTRPLCILWGEPGPHPPAVTFFIARLKSFFLFADHHRKLINFDPSNQPDPSVLRQYLYWQLCLLMFYWSG